MSNSTHRATPLLEVKGLKTAFTIAGQQYNAVDDVSFTLDHGKITCIVGESGCGKSVLSLSIMNLLPKENAAIAAGEIVFDGMSLTELSEQEMNDIRGRDISMIFQEPMTALNPVFTIGFQLQEVLLNHQKISKAAARAKSIELLQQVGISRADSIIDEYPHQLSGGMRQRVMIAIAIACRPKLLIADEPTTALDVTIQAQILDLIKDIQQKRDMSVLLITHDLGVVAEMAEEVIVMYAGQIVERGDVDAIFHKPKHPYLIALLNSIPRLGEEKERLESIQGIVPSLVHMPQVGCRFADRCAVAMEQCRTITPQLAEVEAGHYARCLHFVECFPAHVQAEDAAP